MSTLQVGSRGTQVQQLQQRLMQAGYNVGSTGADGVFGRNTQTAVRQFQQAKGIGVDGRVGNQTRQAMGWNTDSFTPANPGSGTTGVRDTRPGERPYQELQRFAESRGFHVTSTTGGHHLGRGHREGRAIDVRTRDKTPAQVEAFMREARARGYTVIDERRGGNSAWTAPHLHLEIR